MPQHPAAAFPDTPEASQGHDIAVPPRTDLVSAVGWVLLGLAILVGALRMDRLEAQGINPYTIPGLLPALLGCAMTLLGLVLGFGAWQAGGRLFRPRGVSGEAPAGSPAGSSRVRAAPPWRALMVIGLCVAFGVGLVGHGLPFWLAAAIFVAAAVPALQHAGRVATGERLSARTLLSSAAIGLGAGVVVTLVFQELFLVHLP